MQNIVCIFILQHMQTLSNISELEIYKCILIFTVITLSSKLIFVVQVLPWTSV